MSRPNLDMPGTRTGSLPILIDRLRGHGVEVPRLDRYVELKRALADQTPPPAPPVDLFGLTAEELKEYAVEAAIRANTVRRVDGILGTAYGHEISRIGTQLDATMLATIRDNAGAIITSLAKPFDASADVFRRAVRLGIKPSDDLRSLFEASSEVRKTWLSLQHHAAKLDAILLTRQMLSFVAGVEPAVDSLFPEDQRHYRQGHGTGIDWSAAVASNREEATLQPYDSRTPWRRWLTIAGSLELTLPSTPLDTLAMSNPDAAEAVVAEAQRRARAASELAELAG